MAGERLSRLRELLAELATRPVSVERAFRQMIEIFEELVGALDGKPLEEKEEILIEMQEMNSLLSREAPALLGRAGAEEGGLEALSVAPENFSEDHWELVRAARERLNDLAQMAAKMLGSSALDIKSTPPPLKNRPKPGKHHPPHPKRTDWMKT
jgi:hypothetical protein